MTKYIGIFLVLSGIISLIAGAVVEMNYGATAEITGRAAVPAAGNVGYAESALLSYSIISFIMGAVFLFRV